MKNNTLIDFDSVYGSEFKRYLTAKELIEKELAGEYKVVNVELIEIEDTEGTKKRIALHLDGLEDYILALNVTNANIVAGKWGKNVDKWKGKQLELKTTKVSFRGKLVDSILVEPK